MEGHATGEACNIKMLLDTDAKLIPTARADAARREMKTSNTWGATSSCFLRSRGQKAALAKPWAGERRLRSSQRTHTFLGTRCAERRPTGHEQTLVPPYRAVTPHLPTQHTLLPPHTIPSPYAMPYIKWLSGFSPC